MKKLFLFLLPMAFLMACNDSDDSTIEIEGCTNPDAINYNPYANVDDGSCETVARVQGVFALNYTSTGCGVCGGSGSAQFHEIEAAGDNVVAVSSHTAYSDPMENSALNNSFRSCRPTNGGIPYFWVGDVDQVNSGSASDAIDILAQTPPAAMDFTAARNGDVMTVNVQTFFFEELSGEFYLSVYILEDGIDGSSSSGSYDQAGAGDPYEHDFVLRTAATPNDAYGEEIASGTVAAGTLVTNSYDIDLDPSWDDIYVGVVLWEYDSGNSFYSFVNARKKR